MKYDKEHIDIIINAISEGRGRVEAVKMAGISYETFTVWMRDYSEFSERIKKAEMSGLDHIKEKCMNRIIDDKSWQSAAWFLERKFFAEFGNKQPVQQNQNYKIIVQSDNPEIKKLLEENNNEH